MCMYGDISLEIPSKEVIQAHTSAGGAATCVESLRVYFMCSLSYLAGQ